MSGTVPAVVRLLRVDQWVKNTFVFAGVLFSGRLDDRGSLLATAGTFMAFSAVASAGYIDNDIADREADARHPTKRHRPIAAGRVAVGAARWLQLGLLVLGIGLAEYIDRRVGPLVAGYALLGMAYSRWLKHAVVLDVMAIATGFVLRVVAGCAAIHVAPSNWIVLCTFMLALFLGLGKRRHEVILLGAGAAEHRPVLAHYDLALLDQLIAVVGALTIVCYIMFTMWPETVARHGTSDLVYTVPFVMYGLFRHLFLMYHEADGGDPTVTVLTDRHILAAVVLWSLVVTLILGTRPVGEPWILP